MATREELRRQRADREEFILRCASVQAGWFTIQDVVDEVWKTPLSASLAQIRLNGYIDVSNTLRAAAEGLEVGHLRTKLSSGEAELIRRPHPDDPRKIQYKWKED